MPYSHNSLNEPIGLVPVVTDQEGFVIIGVVAMEPRVADTAPAQRPVSFRRELLTSFVLGLLIGALISLLI